MNDKADAPPSSAGGAAARKSAVARKPRFALFVATACGLGYIPIAPGTWGSLAGLALVFVPFWTFFAVTTAYITAKQGNTGVLISESGGFGDLLVLAQVILTIAVAVMGLWAADRAANFWRIKDPQRVVIDEVSGQHLTLLLGLGVPVWWRGSATVSQLAESSFHFRTGSFYVLGGLNWKYLLLGLILFRLFDIWKPFPVRQAESLPGGWGIMADDWVAAIYAGLGLWIARAAGL